MRAARLFALVLFASVASHAPAQDHLVAASPAPPGARSIEILDDGTAVHLAPRAGSPRRGLVARGTRLGFTRRVLGQDCAGAFYQLREGGFVCETHVAPSALEPGGLDLPQVEAGHLLPYDYGFVRGDATPAYSHPRDYDGGEPAETLGEGFGLAIMGYANRFGIPFVRTRRGLYVERDALNFARGSDFGGVSLEGELDLAWVRTQGARVTSRPRGPVVRRAGKREIVRIAATDRGMATLSDGTFIALRDLLRPTAATRPPEVGASERWIDVDTDAQTLVAYEGERPVYATLVSTGRGGPGRETPHGVHRVWIKLAYSDMDDLERDDVERNYAIESVPWVQYFERSNGLHAAFWHDDFGRRRSHGCVNLAPRDASWLFRFTEPALPRGFTVVFPMTPEQGTAIVVR